MGEILARLDPETLAAVQQPDGMFDGYDMETVLTAISCPVLLLQAEPAGGRRLHDDIAERSLRLLQRGSRTQLAGIGHPLHATHPGPIQSAIEAFLAAV